MENADNDKRHWLTTLPGILTALATLIGAIGGLVTVLDGRDKTSTVSAASSGEDCMAGFVWRLVVPSDHICVLPASRARAELENRQAAEHRQSGGGASGPDSCQQGYVWREAFDGDTVCVLPDRRRAVKEENALASERRRH